MSRRVAQILIFSILLIVLAAAPALAHVELSSSDPSDGATVTAVPETIELLFSTEADPAGDGIVLVDANGEALVATVDQVAQDRIVVTPNAPLENGAYGITWTMKAGDAHPKSGSVTFRVDVPATATESAETAPTAQAQDAAAVESLPVFGEPNTAPGEWLGRIGRWAAMFGALVGIGAFAFAATSLVGTEREVQEAGYWVRRSGVLVLTGTFVEVLGASMVLAGSIAGGLSPGSLVEALSGAFGVAVLLRMAGGAAMVQGTAVKASKASAPLADPTAVRPGGDGAAVATAVLEHQREQIAYRLDVHHSVTALIGVGLVTVSYLFDGHTVTAAPAPIVRFANVVHVLGAGVWLGGVLLMGRMLTSRWRRGVALDAAPIAIRFSLVAAVALTVVGVAGFALTWTILDAPSELISTAWGRLLILKLLAVGSAAAMGGYNHFMVIPMLEANRDDEHASDRLRRLVRIEGGILLVVVAITAVFVGAAS
ncbi:MAG: CopD family protein [Actinomycetota bacterium]